MPKNWGISPVKLTMLQKREKVSGVMRLRK